MSDKADIKELAVAAWRLERWLENLNSDRKMAAKSALRSIKKYIAASGVEIQDPVGSKFDPGLAVEVVNNEDESASEEDLIIIETLAPYVYQNGKLIQHARVIIGTTVKKTKVNNEVKQEPIPDTTGKQAPDKDPENEIAIGKGDIERMMEYAKIL